MVALVIIPSQMQETVNNQNPNFVARGMPKAPGIFRSDLKRDRNVSREATDKNRGRERQHIGGPVRPLEAEIQRANFSVVRHQYRHHSPQPRSPAGGCNKLRQLTTAQARYPLLDNDCWLHL
jgi:hypothetical protein